MCELQKSPNANQKINNMYLVKVHGGTTSEEIIEHVEMAQLLAKKNSKDYPGMFTILFFDEANSTEAIGTIKEIMCDLRMNGKHLEENIGLKIIAACNPYKKHSESVIQNFEKSGLGFYVDQNETQEKLGDLPMRHLVYRVQSLPASMLPLVWDFGQLNDEVEKLYITQIVTEKFSLANTLNKNEIDLIISLLACSQKFMRTQKNECSFVSLRDIQRVLKIIHWFLNNGREIFNQMSRKKQKSSRKFSETLSASKSAENVQTSENNFKLEKNVIEENILERDESDEHEEENISEQNESDEENQDYLTGEESETDTNDNQTEKLNFITSLILALNTCYHVGLQSDVTRKEYREKVSEIFLANNHRISSEFILEEINYCYEVFYFKIPFIKMLLLYF
jgi:hypothetical protein